jgi:hypothetical protein
VAATPNIVCSWVKVYVHTCTNTYYLPSPHETCFVFLALDGVEEAGRRREAATVMPNYKVFSGNSNPDLARDIAHRLGLPDLNKVTLQKFSNKETRYALIFIMVWFAMGREGDGRPDCTMMVTDK